MYIYGSRYMCYGQHTYREVAVVNSITSDWKYLQYMLPR